jgi:Holliday junction resolvase-like predicted endonuclease
MDLEELTNLLADHYRKDRQDWKRGGKLYISDIGFWGCKLGKWRQLKDYPQNEAKPGELLMWRQGDRLEEEVADALADALVSFGGWELVDRQTSAEYDEIPGRLDILLRNTFTKELVVVEVKSKRGQAFQYLDEPKHPNVCQTLAYMRSVGASRGLLIYVDREGQNFIRIFEVLDDGTVDLDQEIADLRALRDSDTPPSCMKAVLKRRRNKGPDSLYLSMPTEVKWCSDRECPCKKAIGNLPSGIVAKVLNDGTLVMEEGMERYREQVEELL